MAPIMAADARGRPDPIATFRLACTYPLACLPALVRWKGAETCKVPQRAQSRCRGLSMARVPPIFEARSDTALLPSLLCTEPEVARAVYLGKPMTIHALYSASNGSLSSSRVTTEIKGGVAIYSCQTFPTRPHGWLLPDCSVRLPFERVLQPPRRNQVRKSRRRML